MVAVAFRALMRAWAEDDAEEDAAILDDLAARLGSRNGNGKVAT